jgi:hypothetical protein
MDGVTDSIDPIARQLTSDATTDDKEGATAGG